MPALTDQAIVLRLTAYSETSQVVSAFAARAGQLRLIAKGARRSTATRFSAGLDLLEEIELSYLPPRGDAQLGTLTEWVQREAFVGLRGELSRLYAGLYAAELVLELTEEGDPHPPLYRALRQALGNLAGSAEVLRVLAEFQAALLTAIGYAPNLTECVGCRRARAPRAPAMFSATAGGLLCRDCEMHHVEKRRLPPGLADTTPATGDAAGWFELQDYYLRHLAGRSFKTLERLRESLGGIRT